MDDSKIRFDRLDGSMQREQRTKAMEAFRIDPACEVLLVSIRAGGVGYARFPVAQCDEC